MSRSKYRSNGVPPELDPTHHTRDQYPEAFTAFGSEHLWSELLSEGDDLAAEIETAGSCIVLKGSAPDDSTLNYLRDSIGLITFFLDQGGRAVFDPQTFKWWRPEDWKREIFEPEKPAPCRHVAILYSEDEQNSGKTWYHTRGMRKFGRPDISVHGVPSEHEEGVTGLCQRLINMQALGGIIPENQEIRMESLPPGGIARHGGDLDDPDFNNTHIEIVWPNGL